jgi:hypothetical protein
MSRTLTSRFRRALMSQQTAEVVAILLTIDHAVLETPIRVTSDAVPVTSGGNTYVAFPFTFRFADDRDDQTTTAQLEIDNVDRTIVETLRRCRGAPTVEVSIVLAAAPDTVEAGPWVFTLQQAKYTAATVTGTLGDEDLVTEPYPGLIMTPSRVPGIF